jgi:hypothetical protein
MRFDLSGYVYAAFACGVDVATGRAIDMEYKTQRAKGPMQQATLPLRLAWSQLVTNHYADEDELAVPDGVPVDDIVGMRKVERIAGGWGGRFIGPILVDRDLPNPWYNHAGSMLLNSDERANFRHF